METDRCVKGMKSLRICFYLTNSIRSDKFLKRLYNLKKSIQV